MAKKTVRVILLQDVSPLGKKFDIKEVKPGYARNFLFPKGLAMPATKEAMKDLDAKKEAAAKKAERELERVQEIASQIDGLEVIVPMKTGESGRLYEAVTPQKIAKRLKEMGFEVQEKFIKLENPVKETGEYSVLVEFDHGIEAKITLIVTEAEER